MNAKHRKPTPPKDGKELTFALKEARVARRMTQEELAKRVGLPQPTISHMESTDCRRVTLATMASCISALNEHGDPSSGELVPGDLFKWVEVTPEDEPAAKKAKTKGKKTKKARRKT